MKHLELESFLKKNFDPSWLCVLSDVLDSEYFYQLGNILAKERSQFVVYPSTDTLFRAFRVTPFDSLKGVLLGQDPYFDGSADGLCFSNSHTRKVSPSLNNILKELKNNYPESEWKQDLRSWGEQGLLLINTALSVRQSEPNSHKNIWEEFTRKIITAISTHKNDVIWMLWGNQAQEYKSLITNKSHGFVCTSHPSPLGAYRGFIGSNCFIRFNNELSIRGKKEITW